MTCWSPFIGRPNNHRRPDYVHFLGDMAKKLQDPSEAGTNYIDTPGLIEQQGVQGPLVSLQAFLKLNSFYQLSPINSFFYYVLVCFYLALLYMKGIWNNPGWHYFAVQLIFVSRQFGRRRIGLGLTTVIFDPLLNWRLITLATLIFGAWWRTGIKLCILVNEK